MRIHPATAFTLSAVLFGGGLAYVHTHEKAAVAPVQAPAAPQAPHAIPSPQKATQTIPKPGNGSWYEGWQFARKTVCIDSSISGAPLSEVAGMFSGAKKGGLAVVVGGRAGGCQAKGYALGQRVTFGSMSTRGVKMYGGACAVTLAANYGNLNSIGIEVNVTGYQATACGNYASGEWVDVFAHEFGHAVGLSHDQAKYTSIMRDGHQLDANDRAHLTEIYLNRKS